MKRRLILEFLLTALVMAASLSCSREEPSLPAVLATPKVQVRGLSSSSFHLMWPFVEGADHYVCLIGDREVSTVKPEYVFDGLEPDTDYALSVTAVPAEGSGMEVSAPMMLNIHTGSVQALEAPVPVVVCTYSSKTVIRWNDIAGAAGYDYELNGVKGSTRSPEVTFGSLEASSDYTFRIRTLSPDRYSLDSEYSQVEFTTRPADEDMPPIILDVREAGADYINVNVYALEDVGYYYAAVPGNYLDTYGAERILGIYSDYVREAAAKSGYGLGYVLNFGSMNYDIYPVYPEMKYCVIAFGMDLKGNLTTGLLTSETMTQANDAPGQPELESGVDWFMQTMFLDTYKIYNCSNSVWAGWKGESVTGAMTLLTSTRSFKSTFGSDIKAMGDYAEKNGTPLDDEILEGVNSPTGYFTYYPVSPAQSYTLATVAFKGEEKVLCVSTMATKASSRYYDWFDVNSLGQSSSSAPDELEAVLTFGYDPSSSINLRLSEVRYLIREVSAVSGRTEKELISLVESEGTSLTDTQLAKFNLSGSYRIGFSGLVPGGKYALLAVAYTSAGDRVLRYRSAQLEAGETKALRISGVSSHPSISNEALREIIVPFRTIEDEE